MHELRRRDVLGAIKDRYQLLDTSSAQTGITGRDVRGVEKILSGMVKLMYPHGAITDEQLEELLLVALEARQRVRHQLHLMAAGDYGPVVLSAKLTQSGKYVTPRLPDLEREQTKSHEGKCCRGVLEGTFQQSEFAADITAVHSGKATKEYQDASAFYDRTFITEASSH